MDAARDRSFGSMNHACYDDGMGDKEIRVRSQS